MVRGFLVNCFNEKVGFYSLVDENKYHIIMYKQDRGFMTEKQLFDYIMKMELKVNETKIL